MTTYNSWGYDDHMYDILHPYIPITQSRIPSSTRMGGSGLSIDPNGDHRRNIHYPAEGITNYIRSFDTAIDRTGLTHPHSPTPREQRLQKQYQQIMDYKKRTEIRPVIEITLEEGKSIFTLPNHVLPGKVVGGKDHLIPTAQGLLGINSPSIGKVGKGKRHFA